jgi:hypothetical protein
MPESDASRSECKLIPSESTALGEVPANPGASVRADHRDGLPQDRAASRPGTACPMTPGRSMPGSWRSMRPWGERRSRGWSAGRRNQESWRAGQYAVLLTFRGQRRLLDRRHQWRFRRVGSAEQCARRHPVPAVPARRVRRPRVLPDYLDSFGSSSRMTGGRCRIPLVERWPFALVRGRRTPQAILAGVFFPATWMAWYGSDQLPLRRAPGGTATDARAPCRQTASALRR